MLTISINKFRLVNLPQRIFLYYNHVTASSISSMKHSSDIFSNEAIHRSLQNKPFMEIVRGWFMFNLLRFDSIVNHSASILHWTKRLLGERVTRKLLRSTLYTQFAGGEEKSEVLMRVKRLKQQNIRTFLSYAAELTNQTSEVAFEDMKKYILECIDIVVDSSEPDERMTAIKISPLTSLELQKKVNMIIQNKQNWFSRLNKQEADASTCMMNLQTFHSNIRRIDPLLSNSAIEDIYQEVSSGNEELSARRWLDNLNEDTKLYKLLHSKSTNWLELNSLERQQWNNVLRRVEEIGSVCKDKKVTLLIDAEQTYIQRTIHYLCVHFLMKKFNRDECLVYNTYQCKLRSTYDELKMDLKYAAEENMFYGLKMVRGAYLDEERKRAKEMRYQDPTNPSVEATTEMYNRVMDSSLREVKQGRMKLLVATHNRDSVMRAITQMQTLGISKRGGVKFGQLLGMCDYVSSPLADAGYQIYKAVPYGPIMEIVPYLIRRAQENRYAMKGADFERKVLGREIRNRIKNSFY